MTALNNPGFELGNFTGWDITVTGATLAVNEVSSYNPYEGSYNAFFDLNGGGTATIVGINTAQGQVVPGVSITGSIWLKFSRAGATNGARAIIVWYDSDDNEIAGTRSTGTQFGKPGMASERWYNSSVSGTAPAGAVYARFGFEASIIDGADIRFDAATWDHNFASQVILTSPTNGSEYEAGDNIPFRVQVTGLGTATLESVTYVATDTTTSTPVTVGEAFTAPWAVNYSELDEGEYDVQAEAVFVGGGNLLSGVNTITVTQTPEPPTLREFKASNSYTYLVAESFVGLGAAIPSTALITGMTVELDYTMRAIIRSLDKEVDVEQATPEVLFSVVNNGKVEAILFDKDGDTYSPSSPVESAQVPFIRSDFTVVEEGTSEGKKWTVMDGTPADVTIGQETSFIGTSPIALSDFLNKAIGIRFVPEVGTLPDYADSGDGAIRFSVNRLRISVYFDAGSVEYYFAGPGYADVIKGTLASANVLDGRLETADASGVLQLLPTLEVMDGDQTWIGQGWTIHAAYPPTESNQIGVVGQLPDEIDLGMEYNGLPTQKQVRDNRSRYLFITENFYGDPNLNSMYGVHGLPRAFAYNGNYFYKIYTQADPEKDSPRSVANHHSHLALGFYGGRVDISVVGEPYNYDGVDGASSWAFGDKVVGLLPLSGTILGVFGSKSIWGIAGTTVDNFATQVVSPNIGAIEYTICDMGFPVYANAYGVYTLEQTQQYGDYLGLPMSQAVSPWLRPRLLRKSTSDKEVVCAWPVRSKNQYRLVFSDGYVTSMTLNGQQVPTFSFQKYFYTPSGEFTAPESMYDYPAIVPAAVSSELDNHGEERIHIAPYADEEPYEPEELG